MFASSSLKVKIFIVDLSFVYHNDKKILQIKVNRDWSFTDIKQTLAQENTEDSVLLYIID